MSKKILFFAQGLDMGGMAAAFLKIAKVMEEAGHEVKVVVPYAADVTKSVVPAKYILGYAKPRPPHIRGVTRLVRMFHILTRWKFYFRTVPKWEHDLLVVFRATDFYWTYYTNKNVIGWLHEIAPDMRDDISWFEKTIWRRRLRRYKALVAVSDAVATSWATRFALAEKPLVVQNIIDMAELDEKKNDPVPDWPKVEAKTKMLVCVSRLTFEKGVDRLLAVLKTLRDESGNIHLLIIGDGAMRLQLEEFVSDNGLEKAVTFLGARENPYPYMRLADLVVCPSRAEGMGLVPLEALIVGTPVLATDSGGPKYILRGGDFGGVVDNSQEGLYLGLKKFLNGECDYKPKAGYGNVYRSIEMANENSVCQIRTLIGEL